MTGCDDLDDALGWSRLSVSVLVPASFEMIFGLVGLSWSYSRRVLALSSTIMPSQVFAAPKPLSNLLLVAIVIDSTRIRAYMKLMLLYFTPRRSFAPSKEKKNTPPPIPMNVTRGLIPFSSAIQPSSATVRNTQSITPCDRRKQLQ